MMIKDGLISLAIIIFLFIPESILASQASTNTSELQMRNDMIDAYKKVIVCLKSKITTKQCVKQLNHDLENVHNKYLINIHRGVIHKTTM